MVGFGLQIELVRILLLLYKEKGEVGYVYLVLK